MFKQRFSYFFLLESVLQRFHRNKSYFRMFNSINIHGISASVFATNREHFQHRSVPRRNIYFYILQVLFRLKHLFISGSKQNLLKCSLTFPLTSPQRTFHFIFANSNFSISLKGLLFSIFFPLSI